MRPSLLLTSLLTSLILTSAFAANIILSNDDGWAELSIRNFHDILTVNGHNVVISAPATDKSGSGSKDLGSLELLDGDAYKLTTPCEYNSCQKGSTATGSYPSDVTINYVNSFPATAMRYGILRLAPKFFADWSTARPGKLDRNSKRAASAVYAVASQALEDSDTRMRHVCNLAAIILPNDASEHSTSTSTGSTFLSILSARLHMAPSSLWSTILAIASGDADHFFSPNAPAPYLSDDQVTIVAEEVFILLHNTATPLDNPTYPYPVLDNAALKGIRDIEGSTAGTAEQPDPSTWLQAPPPPPRTGRVDIALSGPNVGANKGLITIASGTFGAAAMAAKLSVPAIAFSGHTGRHHAFNEAAKKQGDTHYLQVYNSLAANFTNALLSTDRPYLPYKTLLNVNFGPIDASEGREKCGDINNWKFVMTRLLGVDERFPGPVDLDICGNGGRLPPEDDVALRHDGCFATVTVAESGGTMETVEKQGEVWNRLNGLGLMTCLPR